MKRLKNFKHLKSGDLLFHFENGLVERYVFLMLNPSTSDMAYIQDFCGNPKALLKFEIIDNTSEWYENCTEIQIARYRMRYYQEMADICRKKYQSCLEQIRRE